MEKIYFSKLDLKKCYSFSKKIIESENQYNRFKKNKIIQLERTFAGKLGELAFLLMLKKNNINYEQGSMFEIFEGKSNVDTYDFKTNTNELVDIKVASKPFHSRIMIPLDQFELKKNFYVGIKLNFKLDSHDKLILNSVSNAIIYGYCDRHLLENSRAKDFGEGLCKYISLKDLKNISGLIQNFQ